MEKLRDSGTDIANAIDQGGFTLLHYAALNSNQGAVTFLLNEGADVDKPTQDVLGWTPLMMAASKGSFGTVELLLNKGADVCAINLNGQTAPKVASEYKRDYSIVKLLLKHTRKCAKKKNAR